jgi:hypothetical protein
MVLIKDATSPIPATAPAATPYKVRFTSVLGFADDAASKAELEASLGRFQGVKVINFYSKDLEELLLAAKYRVIKLSACIFLNGERVVARTLGAPSPETLAMLEQIA